MRPLSRRTARYGRGMFFVSCMVSALWKPSTAHTDVGYMLIGTTVSTRQDLFDAMDSNEAREDALAAQRQAAIYGVQNADNLKADMARGEGEYLASFATILNIPENRHVQVFKIAQQAYPSVWQPGMPAEESMNELMRQLAAANLVASPPLVITERLPR